MGDRAAVFLDGGHVKKRLVRLLGHFPSAADVVQLVSGIMAHDRLKGHTLYRAFYYDAPPFQGKKPNPFTGQMIDFGATPQAAQHRSLIDALDFEPDFAVRRGVLLHHGWKLGRAAVLDLSRQPRQTAASDFVPDFEQKGVDIRIALDMASVALKRLANAIVLVTCDSDFVPVLKLARTEGAKVYLSTMGQTPRPELKAHADLVLS